MTKIEAEEIFISVVLSGKTTLVELTDPEIAVFRVLIGRTLKDMEKRNRKLWLQARQFGIEKQGKFCVVRKIEADRYKMYQLDDAGNLMKVIRDDAPMPEAMSKIDVDEKTGDPIIIDTKEEPGGLQTEVGIPGDGEGPLRGA
jgi:hypothetical protein